MTAENGKVTVGDQVRIGNWNAAVRADPSAKLEAPADYLRRYSQFQPKTTAQNINLSPDFPSVAEALMSVAPYAGAGPVDGVMAVDPQGLAALLELSGPVRVAAWPTEIDAGNVVNVTLRDAYSVFDDNSPERADFLGDVAQAAVDQATSGELGKPAQIAKVLGKAAHEGHLSLAFARPEEQHLAEELGIAQKMGPISSDAVAVTTANAAGNKIDYYLKRTIDYRVKLVPSDNEKTANAHAQLSLILDNTAPTSGLPQYVIGPFDSHFVAGQSRSYLSLYSPLVFKSNSIDGQPTAIAAGQERGRNVYSLFINQNSQTQKTINTELGGVVQLHDGWYSLEVRHQPTLNPDRLHVSIDVPKGWKIDRAPGMKKVFDRRASVNLSLEKTSTLRVHIVRALDTWDIWNRLEAGH
jgi:hypothetical protein